MRTVVSIISIIIVMLSAPVSATEAHVCTAQSDIETSYHDMYAKVADRVCNEGRWEITGPRSWLFFDETQSSQKWDEQAISLPLREFSSITISLRDGSDAILSKKWTAAEAMKFSDNGATLLIPLSAVSQESISSVAEIAVAIDHPISANLLSAARIVPNVASDTALSSLLLIALFVGFGLAPIIYNICFYHILQERFLFWHQAMALSVLVNCIFATGLVLKLDLSLSAWAITNIGPISFAVGVASAAMFAVRFIEHDKLSIQMRQSLHVAALWVAAIAIIFALPIESLRPHKFVFYYIGFLPVLLIFGAAITQALFRGSRAAKFQFAAWVPVMLVGSERIARSTFLYDVPFWVDHIFYAAFTLEIAITALGVADRFLTIKRERDRARTKSSIFKGLAETDPLTGLRNRRAIERKFVESRSDITAVAILDLDHFKLVNDQHGHAVGDLVLTAVAAVLQDSDYAIAGRLGGEEFIVLVFSPNAYQEAERRRTAITRHILHAVPALKTPVTASCGLCHISTDNENKSFDEICLAADKLLYQSKNQGRNRLSTNDAPVRVIPFSATKARGNS